jgi:dTDP-4-dehydrorhamnose reductase
LKVLITGANGQLGKELLDIMEIGKCSLGKINEEYSFADVLTTDSKSLDITDAKLVKDFLWRNKPEVIFNCAAYTHIDSCEVNSELAFKVNALGAKNLAYYSEKIGAKLIQVSTDYVFGGDYNTPYREYDSPNPVNIYGKSKLMGEEFVKRYCPKSFVVRTSALYGKSKKDFVGGIIEAAKGTKCIKIVCDQVLNQTYSEDLVYHLLQLAMTEEYGIYHCTGKGEFTWLEFAEKIIEEAKLACEILPIKSQELKQLAKRPSYCCLDNLALRCTIGDRMRPWDETIKEFISRYEIIP